jgi:hypothetical protein
LLESAVDHADSGTVKNCRCTGSKEALGNLRR